MNETPIGESEARHLATVSHEGRFWDVYLELSNEITESRSYRARLRYSPTNPDQDAEPVRTTTILIEPTYEDVIVRARSFGDHQLVALLRSALPG